LQQFVGIFKEIAKLVALCAQHFRGQLRGNFDSCDGGVFRHVADLIHLDAGVAGERGLQLFCERGGLGVAAGKRAHKSRELRLRQSGRKVNAGNAGRHQQLREAAFAGGGPERHAVEQDLIPGSA
jgi:hypothetical protein